MEMLFQTTTAQGTEFSFAALENQQGAILRDGVVVHTFSAAEVEVSRAMTHYVQLVEQCGGARPPEPAASHTTHPHAG